jgi:hypothetical protein
MEVPAFDIDHYMFDIKFNFEDDCRNLYMRRNEEMENLCADFAIYNIPNTKFYSNVISMKFDTVDYNCHSKSQSVQVKHKKNYF